MIEISKLNGKCKEFAEACYNQNSISELKVSMTIYPDSDENSYSGNVDKQDCVDWGISADEWCIAVSAAYFDKLADLGNK